jgi:REP element-mobilizing transposase RayT
MTHRPRIRYHGAKYHIMSRGNRKLPIFEDDADCEQFLQIVGVASEQYEVGCLTYCLMGNHYHLVIDTPRGNVSAAMKHINGVYAQNSNRRRGRRGRMFEAPFKSIVIENDLYLRAVIKYIVRNPVAARLAAEPSAWKWSSYRATVGLAPVPRFLSLDWMPLMFESNDVAECRRRFHELVDNAAECDELNPDIEVIGSSAFEAAVRSEIGASMSRVAVPRSYRSLARPPLAELFKDVGFSRAERDRTIRRAHVLHGYRLAEIAVFLGLHPNTMSKVLRRLKHWRNEGTELSG